MYNKFFKIFFDYFAAIFLLVVLMPIFIIISLLIYYNMGSPIFFKQSRPGKNEKIFQIYKFRTMSNVLHKNGRLLLDNERLTKLGKFLRAYSLDELPEIINIFKGEMSFIGPRPLLVSYLPKYSIIDKSRHKVKPGITGWAQVNGRNSALFSDRFRNDIWYVENIGFLLDCKIFFLTIKKVLKSDGVISGQDVNDVDDLGFNN